MWGREEKLERQGPAGNQLLMCQDSSGYQKSDNLLGIMCLLRPLKIYSGSKFQVMKYVANVVPCLEKQQVHDGLWTMFHK